MELLVSFHIFRIQIQVRYPETQIPQVIKRESL